MTSRTMIGAALAVALALGSVGCESVDGGSGSSTGGSARAATSTTAEQKPAPVPQIDTGTFGIYQVDPVSNQPIYPYPIGWAWRPPFVPDREIWLLYNPDEPVGISWRSPGKNSPDICLRLVHEGDFDPAGTHWQDGIDQADYDAFRDWVHVEYIQRWPQAAPEIDPAQFAVRDHQLLAH